MKIYINRIVKYKFCCNLNNKIYYMESILIVGKIIVYFGYIKLDYVDVRIILKEEMKRKFIK